ncbi:MAG: cystathionine gamma-synthase [Acidimicrobiales bacterium]
MTGPDGGPPWGFATRAIHAGQAPDPVTGAVVPPLSLATTFAQDSVGHHRGYEYSRSANPTRAVLEAALADLEGAARGLAFASGVAATDAVMHLLAPGDHVVIPTDAYGGTFRLVARVWGALGVDHSAVDLADMAALRCALGPRTRLVWAETPSNPMLHIVDIAALAEETHRHGALLAVDNTFATPYLQQPLALGADVVVHSTTKYLGGHSDVVGGFVATADAGVGDRIAFFQNAGGAVPSPFDCYLVLRGAKTLALRMDRHCANAEAVAALLAGHPAVARVLYPGLSTHPGHRVAAGQMSGFGGMVSLVLRGGEPAAVALAGATELFTLAESLGAVESLIEHPRRMTHASAAGSPLAVDPGLVRLSVGVETSEDLLADLAQALDRVGQW